MSQILNRFTNEVIAEDENKTIRQLALENQADLRRADLRRADLRNADLSGAIGLKKAADFLMQFKQDELGILVYKSIGDTTYEPPSTWEIKACSVLTENVNPTVTQECGCGVNFGTKEFCKKNYPNSILWMARIAWIDCADIVVPIQTDGKARCARLTLLKKVK